MGEFADYEIDRMIDEGVSARTLMFGSSAMARGPACPECGQQPNIMNTQYGVKRECCGLWGWGKHAPLVDAETHQARAYAHKVFDSLWQSGLVGRSRAYALLAQELGIRPDACHMKLMDKETAWRVPEAAHRIGKRLKGVPT